MKKIFYPLVAFTMLLTSAAVSVTATDHKVSEGSSIQFKSKDPSGSFKSIKGNVKFDEADLDGSKFDLAIDVNSINTGNGMQNKKAMTEEWFQESKYPTIKYVSSKIEKSGSDIVISGSLTMKGVTKDKKITTKVSKTDNGYTFTGSFSVNRLDFKVGKKSDVVPDVMNINFTLPVAKK